MDSSQIPSYQPAPGIYEGEVRIVHRPSPGLHDEKAVVLDSRRLRWLCIGQPHQHIGHIERSEPAKAFSEACDVILRRLSSHHGWLSWLKWNCCPDNVMGKAGELFVPSASHAPPFPIQSLITPPCCWIWQYLNKMFSKGLIRINSVLSTTCCCFKC